MNYQVGDKVWSISQCYPGRLGIHTGSPYRTFVRRVEDDGHVWLGAFDDKRGSCGTTQEGIHHDLFELLKKFKGWHINSPVDVTWPGSSYIDTWRDAKNKEL